MFKLLVFDSPLMIAVLGCSLFAIPFLSHKGAQTGAKSTNNVKLEKARTFEGAHKGFFSPDGVLLALMNKNHADVVKVASGQKLYTIALPNSTFLGMAFSPNNRLIAASYRVDDGKDTASVKVTIWDALTGKEERTLPVVDHDWRRIADDLTFSADSRLLATNVGGVARLWEVSSGTEMRKFLPQSEPVGLEPVRTLLSPDGKWMAVYFKRWDIQRPYDQVHVWELATGRETVLDTEVNSDWRFSSDSTLLALSAKVDKGKTTERAAAEIWEVGAWKRKRTIEAPRSWQGVFTLDFSANSEHLAVGGFKKFGIYSVQTGQLITEKTHAGKPFWTDSQLAFVLSHIEYSRDGRLLLTGGNDETVKLWSVLETR